MFSVCLVDTTTDVDIHINDVLVETGIASFSKLPTTNDETTTDTASVTSVSKIFNF